MKQLHIESIETPEEALEPIMQEYIQLLKAHDWTYQYSDDGSAYRAGKKMSQAIQKLADTVDPDRNIYWEYSPFTRPASEVK
jgi:hypothetical protein